MTKPRASIPCPREPLGLSLEEAARFVGVSSGLFKRLVHEGVMPFARRLGSRRIWDADEVAAAFRRIPHATTSGLLSSACSMHDNENDPWDRVRA